MGSRKGLDIGGEATLERRSYAKVVKWYNPEAQSEEYVTDSRRSDQRKDRLRRKIRGKQKPVGDTLRT